MPNGQGGLGPGGEREVSISWVRERVLGDRTVVIVVDPGGVINEYDETNNQQSLVVNIQPRTFDMALSSGINLVSSPLEPEGEYTAAGFAEDLGASVLVEADSTGFFRSYVAGANIGESFPILSGAGYIRTS